MNRQSSVNRWWVPRANTHHLLTRDRLLDPLAAHIRRTLKDRVSGGDAASQQEREDRIWRAPGERWFTPDDPIWWAHSDASIFVGGIAALLVQSLHPLAMAGVMGHSSFRDDPWRRLHITADHVAITTYAPVPDAERQVRIVNAVHKRVVGTAPDGRPYAASDPHLLTWVHVAETWAFLACYQRFGPKPLSPSDADAYVSSMAEIGARLGVPDPPRTVAALEGALAAYGPELEGTSDARETASFLLDDPPLRGPERWTYAALSAAAVATVPAWTREMLGRNASGARLKAGATAGHLAVRGLRAAMAHPAHEPHWQAELTRSDAPFSPRAAAP